MQSQICGATSYDGLNTSCDPGLRCEHIKHRLALGDHLDWSLSDPTTLVRHANYTSWRMVLDRLQQLTQHVSGARPPPHPFDPLSTTEIDAAVALVRNEHGSLNFNAVTLYEPRKAEMLAWLAGPNNVPRPARAADVVAISSDGKVYDGVVDLDQKKIVRWEHTPNVQPLITMEDLQEVEHIVRKDPKVIEQCGKIGIPPEDMYKVYCDREYCKTYCGDPVSNRGYSMDNWIRRALWHQRSTPTSSHVLPPSFRRVTVHVPTRLLSHL